MKIKSILIAAPLILGAVFISQFATSKLNNFTTLNRAGDPTGPGITSVKNCTSCHSGMTAIANDASRVFTFGDGNMKYYADSTYQVKFRINANGPVGFSATVLRNDSNLNAGMIVPADTLETKLFQHLASGRYYLNHRTGIPANGYKEYAFTWTAPKKGSGNVTFYFGSLTGDGDSTTSADTSFTNSYVITEEMLPVGVITSEDVNPSFTVWPNPASEKLFVNFDNQRSGNVTIRMYSIDGRHSVALLNQILPAGKQNLNIDLPGQVVPGVYILQFTAGEMNKVQKILVN